MLNLNTLNMSRNRSPSPSPVYVGKKGSSGTEEYLDRVKEQTNWFGRIKNEDRFNPTVVVTQEEYCDIIRDLATRCSLRVRSVILPPGVTMDDPRLRTKLSPPLSVRSETLSPGILPKFPDTPFISDIPLELNSPDWTPYSVSTGDLRFQVIPDDLLPVAETINSNKIDQIPGGPGPKVFSPKEVRECSWPHRRLSDVVRAEERKVVASGLAGPLRSSKSTRLTPAGV